MPRSSSSISRWRHPEMEVQSKCGRLWKHRKYWISISRTPSGTYRVSSIKLLESRIPNATSKFSWCKNSSNTNIIIIRKNWIWTYHNASLHRSSLMCLHLRNPSVIISRYAGGWRRSQLTSGARTASSSPRLRLRGFYWVYMEWMGKGKFYYIWLGRFNY